jgi:UDP-glucose 4-epimerase
LDYLKHTDGLLTVNLGAGRGFSVLEMVAAFEKASGKSIPYQVAPRRLGDIAQFWADPTLANTALNWQTRRTLDQMCADAWRWQQHAAGLN